ncbi:hypothetical protein VOI54_04945 [Tamlana sp. 2201CG12-4]|uniref:hypothetical protein n=1 Tax=Tamlana sp. 2201CG12-4 TaxID=3112582 RepID=UPI002DBF4AE3|nr:hypothetical protein [Tamlana sp. 2201CG12-4]MEC3906353.1 hypothetical protein [Tamlana sp. 2201CG12-4]
MGEKKHIDRLFQESFKDFEATPGDAVWKNIEAKLNNKKRRRVIPIWWRYAGIAALLLLLLTIGTLVFNTTDNAPEIEVVNSKDTSQENDDNLIEPPLNTVKKDSNTGIATSNDLDEIPSNQTSNDNPTIESATITKLKTTPTSIAKHSTATNKNEGHTVPNKNVIAQSSKTDSIQKDIAIANSIEAPKENINPIKEESSKTSVATVPSTDTPINNNSESNTEILIDKAQAKDIIKASSNNTVAKNKTQDNTLTIEEAIEKDKAIIEEEEKQNRWSIAPNAAPVYFNTLGKGSSIDQQFNNNSKTGDVNMSYGIATSYAINNKLKIRSGINKVNLGYNTNNVVVFQSSNTSSSALKNVDSRSNNDANVSLVSGEALNSSETPESFSNSNISINQTFGYIEIPLEFQYSLSQKRLGVNVIGGFSSFFLNNNRVYSENANGNRTFLGEDNNLNKTSYSANFGFGLNYKFSKKIDLNLEPMFKYQFNTFNNTSGNFTPFFIGVYTGFAIKF